MAVTDYHKKKERRIEGLRRGAERARKEADAAYKQFKAIGDCIPLGQPVLVGHYSEKHHRRDIARMDRAIEKSIEARDKMQEYERRAMVAEENTAISSDDPDAIEKIQEKLEHLEKKQGLMVNSNKIMRKKGLTNEQKQEQIAALYGVPVEKVRKVVEVGGFHSWQLSNNNAEIRRLRERVKNLEALNARQDKEYEIGPIRIVENATENRVQMFFPGKPDEDTRKALKRNGFRWAPSVGAWQAFFSNRAIATAKGIAAGEYVG